MCDFALVVTFVVLRGVSSRGDASSFAMRVKGWSVGHLDFGIGSWLRFRLPSKGGLSLWVVAANLCKHVEARLGEMTACG